MDEHIYSEPVIDGLVVKGSRSSSKRFDARKDGLDNLESSIKNLELHLKLLNRPTLPAACDICYHDEKRKSTSSGSDRLPTIMEGIDGAVIAGQVLKDNSNADAWQNTVDDSLMDIDLDSFLLANEVRARKKEPAARVGHDNPSFVHVDDADEVVAVCSTDSDKYIDNNYKCTKYVNSCPEDAYNVEGVIGYNVQPAIDKSLSMYLKKCENQIHYQNTKDILEEIREKLDSLLTTKTSGQRTKDLYDKEATAGMEAKDGSNDGSLHENILSLRNDLENYLKMMNRQNEIEIKQFCSGLSKNYKLLTIQQALENKARSRHSEYDFPHKYYYYAAPHSDIGSKDGKESADSGLEANRELSLYKDCEVIPQFDTVYVHDGLPFAYNHHTKYSESNRNTRVEEKWNACPLPSSFPCQRESMRSSSDANFHLQRRRESLCSSCGDVEVMQCVDIGDTEDTSAKSGTITPADSEPEQQSASHIVNNLAMQQPSLITGGVGDKELMLDWHRNKPSIWEQYYGSKRLSQAVVKKIKAGKHDKHLVMSYVSRHNFVSLFSSFFFCHHRN